MGGTTMNTTMDNIDVVCELMWLRWMYMTYGDDDHNLRLRNIMSEVDRWVDSPFTVESIYKDDINDPKSVLIYDLLLCLFDHNESASHRPGSDGDAKKRYLDCVKSLMALFKSEGTDAIFKSLQAKLEYASKSETSFKATKVWLDLLFGTIDDMRNSEHEFEFKTQFILHLPMKILECNFNIGQIAHS